MSDSEKLALNDELAALRATRDELKLQAHLLRAEVRDRWNELEAHLDALNEHLGRAEVAAQTARGEVDVAAQLMLDVLKNGYAQIRGALRG
ncbi:hypothetical protein [Solimonas marina]|uniref:Uncharacterized protein n=1 Tax=Solimonas marina TaxID=2714601 RepID=A0A969WC61_9GAMM|nr:hypothetical protein [Solimonas marina]NKF23494.1 hypothetical protein [Solimonas marina]